MSVLLVVKINLLRFLIIKIKGFIRFFFTLAKKKTFGFAVKYKVHVAIRFIKQYVN